MARPAVCADVPELVVEGEGAELLVLTQEAQQHAYTTTHTDVGNKAFELTRLTSASPSPSFTNPEQTRPVQHGCSVSTFDI